MKRVTKKGRKTTTKKKTLNEYLTILNKLSRESVF